MGLGSGFNISGLVWEGLGFGFGVLVRFALRWLAFAVFFVFRSFVGVCTCFSLDCVLINYFGWHFGAICVCRLIDYAGWHVGAISFGRLSLFSCAHL